jgi:hypothetical protein
MRYRLVAHGRIEHGTQDCVHGADRRLSQAADGFLSAWVARNYGRMAETLSPRSSRRTGASISRWHDPSRFRRVHATRLLESSGCRREHVLIGHGDSFHVTRLGLDRIAAARQARLAGEGDLCGDVEQFTIVSVGACLVVA